MLSPINKAITKSARMGYRLPYSTYTPEMVESIYQHKRNNISAIILSNDGLNDYLTDNQNKFKVDSSVELFNEIIQFCIYGILGIGYFGVVVEDSMPKRVDSMGRDMTKYYKSAYENITTEQYQKMGRIDSMILDQQDNRRFMQYVKKLEYILYNSFVSKITEITEAKEDTYAEKCLKLDDAFCAILNALDSFEYRDSLTSISAYVVSEKIDAIVTHYRKFLDNSNVNIVSEYTKTDLEPIKKLPEFAQ